MATKMTTAAVLAGVGDIIAQWLEHVTHFSPRRLTSLISVNVFYITPLLSVFYDANNRLVGEPLARRGEAVRTGALEHASLHT